MERQHPHHQTEGLGLATLHRLAADLAGTFTVHQAGGGTHLLWTAPLPVTREDLPYLVAIT